ncbi:MAG: hypothetical protein NC299_15770 [Lachnospiraceae bacterium]|nr:hypothetical protein [Lachnospiraceae bacterium]
MIKSITLTGTEVRVDGLGGQNAAVKNLGAGTLYASIYPNIEPNADNVAEIPPNGGEVLLDANGTVYLLGTGKVQCTGTPYAAPNFKQPSPSGETSGGGGENTTADVGVYCGTAEFVDSSVGVKSIPIDSTNGLPQALAAALAEETGWELQSDGVTVLKDGGVGYHFTSNYVYTANNVNVAPGEDNFQYISGASPYYLDVFQNTDKTVTAFGVRSGSDDVNLTFILANDGGEDIDIVTYKSTLYFLKRDEASCDIVTYATPCTGSKCVSVFALPDTARETVFKNVFLMSLCPARPIPAEQFVINGERFVTVYNAKYDSTQPILALPYHRPTRERDVTVIVGSALAGDVVSDDGVCEFAETEE